MKILSMANGPLDPARGSGYVICGFAEGLARRGHTVRLLGPPDFEPGYGLRRAIRWRQALGMARAALREAAAGDYDVIELYGGEAWLAFAALRRIRERRFLLVARSNGLETHLTATLGEAAAAGVEGLGRRWFQPRGERFYERAYRGADLLVTVSDYDRDFALARGYQPADRVLTIDNPLLDSFLGVVPDLDRPPVLGFCGSWLPIKGIQAMVREVPRLLATLPEWRLVLVGVGKTFSAARVFPADLLARIEVMPEADRETELAACYRRFAILLSPSLYESFGLVAAEGMAHGCAVAATPVGFAASLRDGEEVVHLDRARRGDEGPLYDAARSLATDEALRRRVAAGGHRRVQGLTWQRSLARLEAAYEAGLDRLRRERR